MSGNSNRKIVLEDGSEFYGESFGCPDEKIAEIIFNTSMAGYQEVLSDPSFTDMAVVMTYPIIGNYGCNDEDYEALMPALEAMIVRDICERPSNFRCTETLDAVMKRFGISGVSGVDTRALTRKIKQTGSRAAYIADAGRPLEECIEALKKFEPSKDRISRASTKDIRKLPAENKKYSAAVLDLGAAKSFVNELNRSGIDVTLYPFDTPADVIISDRPDAVIISGGPGSPEDVPEVVSTVKELTGKCPLCGYGTGFEIIALAYGAKAVRLKYGRGGANHAVRELKSGKVGITSRNQLYTIDENSLADTPLVITHKNVLDGTVEGFESEKDRVFAVQYTPSFEGDPQDPADFFNRLISMMEEEKNA